MTFPSDAELVAQVTHVRHCQHYTGPDDIDHPASSSVKYQYISSHGCKYGSWWLITNVKLFGSVMNYSHIRSFSSIFILFDINFAKLLWSLSTLKMICTIYSACHRIWHNYKYISILWQQFYMWQKGSPCRLLLLVWLSQHIDWYIESMMGWW